MTKTLECFNDGKYWLVLAFVSLVFISFGMMSHNAFAMGQNGCINEYDGPFTSFTINNGSKTFDALANQGMTFNSYGSFNVTFVIHTPNINSGNNSNSGATWFGDDFYGYENGQCIGTVGPNQNVTGSETLSKTHTYGGYVQSVTFGTRASSSATFNVQWLSPPANPQNLQSIAGNSQVTLSWTAPSNNGGSTITGYMIERSNNTGTTWSTVSSNTGSTSTTYSDTGLAPSTTYTYRVSAINTVGTSQPSNVSSATTNAITPPPPTGITLNNIKSTSGTVSASPYQITLANFNPGTGSNQLLVVGISADNNNAISVTFGGSQLTRKVSTFSNNDAEFWYLKNPSSTGTGTIAVTMSGSTSAVVGAYSFSGVNQTNPLPTSTTKHNTTPNSPNVTMTTKFAKDWVLDLPSIYGGITLGSPTCTQQWNTHMPGAITGASSSIIQTTPGSVTCKWTASSAEFWDDAAIEIAASK